MNSNSNFPFNSSKPRLEKVEIDHFGLIALFEEIKKLTFNETSQLKFDAKWTALVGKPKFYLKNNRLPSHNFQITKVFPDSENTHRYAAREKIHLYEGCQAFLENRISKEAFDVLQRAFYLYGTRSYELAQDRFGLNENQIFQQILLIRYFQEPLSFDFPLHKLGSEFFGEVHEDETLFSIHLGETSEELQTFNYEINNWEEPSFDSGKDIMLWGQQSQYFNMTPTPHRLIPKKGGSQQRFSFIIENILTERAEKAILENIATMDAPTFEMENQIALISDTDEMGHTFSENQTVSFAKKLEEKIEKIFPRSNWTIQPIKAFISNGEAKGFKHLLIFTPNYKLENLDSIDRLYSKSYENRKKLVIYQEPWSEKQGVWLINLESFPLDLLKSELSTRTLNSIQKNWPNHGLID